MPDISNLTVSNITYDIKDAYGRLQLDEINSQISSFLQEDPERKLGLEVDFENKTFKRIGLCALAIDPYTGQPFSFDNYLMYSGRTRCNVSNDRTILAYYGDPTYKEDGSNGQVMVKQPKFYYKVEPIRLEPIADGCGYHLRKVRYWISDVPLQGFKVHPAFYNEKKEEKDCYFTGAYEASIFDVSENAYIQNDSYGDGTTRELANIEEDMLSSIAGIKPCSGLYTLLTRPNCEKLGNNRGSGWHNTTVQIEMAEALLQIIEFGTMNIQSVLGRGVDGISDNRAMNCAAITGATSYLGNESGRAETTQVTRSIDPETNMPIITTYNTNGTTSVSYRGRENPYANIYKWVQGLLIHGRGAPTKGGIPYVCNDFTFNENPTITTGQTYYDTSIFGYTSAGFTIPSSAGWINAMGYGNKDLDWLFMPSEVGGNSSLPVGDYISPYANINGLRASYVGGYWNAGDASRPGPFDWYLYNASSIRDRHLGGRAATWPK